MAAPQFSSEMDLESVSSEDLGGAGITGIMTGTAGGRPTTTTLTSPIAARSSIATTSITTAVISTTAMHSTGTVLEAEIQDSMGFHLHTSSQEHTPAHSVDL